MEASEEQSSQEDYLKNLFDKIENHLKHSVFDAKMAHTSLTQLLNEGPDTILAETNPSYLRFYLPLAAFLKVPNENQRKIVRGAIALKLGFSYDTSELRDAIRDGGTFIRITDVETPHCYSWELLEIILQAAIKLTSLELNLSCAFRAVGEKLNILSWEAFLAHAPTLPHLTSLDLDENNLGQLTETDWDAFYRSITAAPHLMSLSLSHNNLNQLNVSCQAILFKTFLEMPRLTSLNLYGNYLNKLDDFWKPFCDTLIALRHLTSLDLRINGLDQLSLHLAALSETFQKMPHLSSLNFSEDELANMLNDEQHMDAFCHTLKTIPHLTSLYLNGNSFNILNPARTKTLCNTFETMPRLSSLSLERNELFNPDSELFNNFCQALPNMSHLTSLNLSSNSMLHLHLTSLNNFCEALKKMPHLTSLELRTINLHYLDDSRFKLLCQTVLALPHLTSINLADMSTPQGVQWTTFIQLLESNFRLLNVQIAPKSLIPIDEKRLPIEKIMRRNKAIHDAGIKAHVFLNSLSAKGTPLQEVNVDMPAEKILEQLSSAITALKQIQTPEADAHRESLEALHDELARKVGNWFAERDANRALHFYQETAFETKDYTAARLGAFPIVVRAHRDDPEKSVTKLQAFVLALPLCLDPKNRLISFDNDNSRDFDAALLEAALDAIGLPDEKVLSLIDHVAQDNNRLKLLKFVVLMDLKTRLQEDAQTSTAQTDFYKVKKSPILSLLEAKLSPATKLHEILQLPIDEVWERIDQASQTTLSQLKEQLSSIDFRKR